MPTQVISTAQLACTFGAAPAALTVLPVNRVKVANQPAATIMDFAPTVNIPPFGMCSSPSNPQVIAATAAAMGVLTPMPCLPATVAPWSPGAATVKIGNMAALDNVSKCNCMWAGVISITMPGQTPTSIP